MKRTIVALVVGFAAAGSARADWGGFGPPTPQGGYPVQPVQGEFTAPHTLMGLGASRAGRPPDRYGLLPGLRKAFRIGGSSSCSSCGASSSRLGGLFHKGGCSTCGKGSHGGYYQPAPQYPPVMQGTLVFPYNSYTRSPRDFFMYEPSR